MSEPTALPAPRRNLERKARCPDPSAARAALRELETQPEGVQMQIDTYFMARSGRLKLREIEGRGAELIWYDRPDREEARLSAYHLVPVSDPALLRAALA